MTQATGVVDDGRSESVCAEALPTPRLTGAKNHYHTSQSTSFWGDLKDCPLCQADMEVSHA